MQPSTSSLPLPESAAKAATSDLRAFAVDVDEEDFHSSAHITPESSPQQRQLAISCQSPVGSAGWAPGPSANAVAAAALLPPDPDETAAAAPRISRQVAGPIEPAALAFNPVAASSTASVAAGEPSPLLPQPLVPRPPTFTTPPISVPGPASAAGAPVPAAPSIAAAVPPPAVAAAADAADAAEAADSLFGAGLNLPGVPSQAAPAASTPVPMFFAEEMCSEAGSGGAAAGGPSSFLRSPSPGGSGGGAAAPGTSPAASSASPGDGANIGEVTLPLTAPRPGRYLLVQGREEEQQQQHRRGIVPRQQQPAPPPPQQQVQMLESQAPQGWFSSPAAAISSGPATKGGGGGGGGVGGGVGGVVGRGVGGGGELGDVRIGLGGGAVSGGGRGEGDPWLGGSWPLGGRVESDALRATREPLVSYDTVPEQETSRRRTLVQRLMSYTFDWLLAAALLVFDFTVPLKAIHPVQRFSSPGDPALSYPRRADTVPTYALAIISLGGPAVVFLLASLLSKSGWRFILLHHGLLSLAEAMSLFTLFKHFLNLTGVYRPDWFADVATGDPRAVSDGRLAYPSGHAGFSASAAALVALFLAGHIRLFAGPRRTGQFARVLLCGSPLAVAAFVAATRVVDYKHAPADINAGAVLGLLCGAGAYLANFHSPFGRLAGQPRLHGPMGHRRGAEPSARRPPSSHREKSSRYGPGASNDDDGDEEDGITSSYSHSPAYAPSSPDRRRADRSQQQQLHALMPSGPRRSAAAARAPAAAGAVLGSVGVVGVDNGAARAAATELWDVAGRGGGGGGGVGGGGGFGIGGCGSSVAVPVSDRRPVGKRPPP